MKTPLFAKTIIAEVFSLSSLLWIIFLAILYIFSIDLLLNYKLLTTSIANHFPLMAFLSLLWSLFIGSFTSTSAEPGTLIIFFLNAILVGVNVLLLIKSIVGLEQRGKAHITLGGTTIFSIVTAGCASCGLSLLSILGLSATLTVLPFHGAELRYISFFLLIVSAFYMLKKLHEAKYCRI